MSLRDRRILVVEDEFMIAAEIRGELEDLGAVVLGPEPSVARALERLAREACVDAAVLDVSLGGQQVFPVAAALAARRVPFLFASGYGEQAIARHYPGAVNCSKPLDMGALVRALRGILPRPAGPRGGVF